MVAKVRSQTEAEEALWRENQTSIVLMVMFLVGNGKPDVVWTLYLMTVIAFVIGAHLVMVIGGADMTVVVLMLNNYSGWAAGATGFLLGNDLLIVIGVLVGGSGAILPFIMCRAMNPHFLSVILGGFGGAPGPARKIAGSRSLLMLMMLMTWLSVGRCG